MCTASNQKFGYSSTAANMFTNSLFAAGALLSLVAAVPMQQNKRDVVWVTETQEDVVTVPVTKTVWIEPGETPPTAPGHYGHGHKSQWTSHIKSTVTVPAASPSSPAETSPVSTYVAPTTSSSEEAPAPTSTYVAPTSTYVAPTSTYVAPSPTTPTSTYEAPSTTSEAAPAQTSSYSGGGGSGSGQSYSGDLTYYTPGLGSCGKTNSGSDMIVAVAEDIMTQFIPSNGNPNDNTLCGKQITITANGVTQTATIEDTCPGCADGGLDLTPTLFQKFDALSVGRITGMTWTMNG